MFLRHKLQKGLLGKEGIKEEDMKPMSEFITKLEGYADLEVSIIRATKINKVLKAILKLKDIPKEEEFKFKVRSQTLLDTWNKLLESETPVAATAATNGDSKPEADEAKDVPAASPEITNGVKESTAGDKGEEKSEDKTPKVEPASEVSHEAPKDVEATSVPVDNPIKVTCSLSTSCYKSLIIVRSPLMRKLLRQLLKTPDLQPYSYKGHSGWPHAFAQSSQSIYDT